MTKAPDKGMLSLFSAEAGRHAAAFRAGLAAPGQGAALQKAARGIKASAALVGLAGAKALGSAMETASLSHAPGTETARALENAVQVFEEAAKLPPENLASFFEEKAREIDELSRLLESPAPAPQKEAPPPQKQPPEKSVPPPDASILELFLEEVKNHSRVLEEGLIAAESQGRAGGLEPLMRAAHSIKGAARIAGADALVDLAHAMEDAFVRAMDGRIPFTAGLVDELLPAVDAFKRLSGVRPDDLFSWLETETPVVADLLGRVTRAGQGEIQQKEPLAGKLAMEPPPQAKAPAPAPEPAPVDPEAPVMVTGRSLSRVLGLAGQCLVETESLAAHREALFRLKERAAELVRNLARLYEHSLEPGAAFAGEKTLEEALKAGEILARDVNQGIEDFEDVDFRWQALGEKLYRESLMLKMRPIRDGLAGFGRMVRDIARQKGKRIRFQVLGEDTRVDRDILARLETPLTHLIKNACDHGLETPEERAAAGKGEEASLTLEARHQEGMLVISVSDDGRGVDTEALRKRIVDKGLSEEGIAKKLSRDELLEFLFLPGFSTAKEVTEVSGRGVGLDAVRAVADEVGGSVQVETEPGAGTRFLMKLPLTLSVLRTLLVTAGGEPWAFPLARVDRVLKVLPSEIHTAGERPFLSFEGGNLGLARLEEILGLPHGAGSREGAFSVVVVSDSSDRYGVMVDGFLGEKALVVRPLDKRLGKVANISAGALLDDGQPVLILDADDLVRSIHRLATGGTIQSPRRASRAGERLRKKRILVVDDSATVREAEKRLLVNRGYAVDVAVDGMDGWNQVSGGSYDLVVADVDMPRMNGIELVRRIKGHAGTARTPVVIVSYKDRKEDREAGLLAGADYYLTKKSFQDDRFIQAVTDLIGGPGS